MYNLLITNQPRSHNTWKKMSEVKKLSYRTALKESLQRYHGEAEVVTDSDLYGLVYYFHKSRSTQDADNLSKPVWDSLKGVLYPDDNIVKFRIAGMFNLSEDDSQTLDITSLPPEFASDFLHAIDTEEHIVYIECGRMRNDFFRFNIE